MESYSHPPKQTEIYDSRALTQYNTYTKELAKLYARFGNINAANLVLVILYSSG